MENNVKVSSGAITDRGLSEKRPQNEDAFLEIGTFGIYAVADGVGGAQAGEVASQMAVEILGEAFTNRAADADAEIVMRTAFERANTAIFQMAHELPQLATMATTIVALHVDGNIATIGHVGDSRLYRVDRDGILYRETDDHSMVGEEVRAGRMTEEQAENHPSRNIISRALGAEPEVSIDLKTILIDPGTAFLICSDGVTRHVGDQEIKGVLTFGGAPTEICDYLKNLCYERGAEDNLTAVVVKVAGVGNAAAASAHGYHDLEEPTVATVRIPAADTFAVDDEGDLLGLETLQMDWPDPMSKNLADEKTLEDLPEGLEAQETQENFATNFQRDETSFETEETTYDVDSDTVGYVLEEPQPERAVVPGTVPQPEMAVVPETVPHQEIPVEARSIFEETTPSAREEEKSGSAGKMAAAVGLLLLGSLIGLGAYHFALAPAAIPAAGSTIPTMKSENIEFTSFEKNRRNVDADPEAYLREVPPADDAEDYYLIGRANILKGDFHNARMNLVEAQKRVLASPATNTKILATDISLALMIANDAAIQPRLKTQIESTLNPQSLSGANSNR